MAQNKGGNEVAKRLLKSRGILYNGCPEMLNSIQQALISASDANPRINVHFEEIILSRDGPTTMTLMGAHGIVIGGNIAPEMNTLWIRNDSTENVNHICKSIVELAAAGYPGCSGCVDDTKWSESEWRNTELYGLQ